MAPLVAVALLCVAVPAQAEPPRQLDTVDLLSDGGLRLDGAHARDITGRSVASAGDVNGDGRPDAIAGAHEADPNGRESSGSAYVVFGSEDSASTLDLSTLGSRGFRIDGAGAGDRAGWSVAGAGDANGDGLADAIVGAPGADRNGSPGSGSAYVIFGTESIETIDLNGIGMPGNTQGFRIDGAGARDAAGGAVSTAGDVNGDGLEDVLVGASFSGNNGRDLSGSAYVVFGKQATGTVYLGGIGVPGNTEGYRLDGAGAWDIAGGAVAAAGDLNGDWLDDVVVGAYWASNNGRPRSGSVYVAFGKRSNETIDLAGIGEPGNRRGFRIDGASANDGTGGTIAGEVNVNGDGLGDLVIGAPNTDRNGRKNAGSAYVIFGKPSSLQIDLADIGTQGNGQGYRIDGAAPWDGAGVSVAGAGDMDGDGLADLAVGAPRTDNNGRSDSGSAYVIFGKQGKLSVDLNDIGTPGDTEGYRIDGAAANDWAGVSVAGGSDVNGGGNLDVIVSALYADRNDRADSGSVHVVFGEEPVFGFLAKWGESGTGNGELDRPYSIDVDPSGDVYVADTYNHRVQKFNEDGDFLGSWGGQGGGDGQFHGPKDVATDSDGNVYVVDSGNHRIQKFDGDGSFVAEWGSAGEGDGQFQVPYGIATDSDSNVYVTDAYHNRVQKFDSDGVFLARWGRQGEGDGEFIGPHGVAVDPDGMVYVADTHNDRVQKFDSDGGFLARWGSDGEGDGQFDYPKGVATDSDGNIYISDSQNNRIQRFDSEGGFLGKWGSFCDVAEEGVDGCDGDLYRPHGVATDPSGDVYVADTFNHRIQRFGERRTGGGLFPARPGVRRGSGSMLHDKRPGKRV